MLQWKWCSFQDLTNQDLYSILALRQSVFIVEQQCRYIDIDGRDEKCMHLMGIQNNQLAAYLRVLPKDVAYPDAMSFGRVVTAQFARKQGLGKELIQQTLLYLNEIGNTLPVIISAQMYLEKFYQSFGFESVGKPYQEDGIPHIKMKRK